VEGDFQVGPWLIEPSLNAVSHNGQSIHLAPKVMAVLVCLAERAGQSVSKEDLLQTVWPDTFVGDDVLKGAISELRRVLEDDAREPTVIQTIPKRGYRLVAPVMPANGASVTTLPAAQPSDPRMTVARPGGRKLWFGALTLSGAGLLFGLLVLNFGGLRARLLRDDMPPIHSLAVLPLQNLSSDPAQEYFADAMTEELITELSRISALKVTSRTSVMRYKKSASSLPEIARELNVDAIVEGSVLRSGNRVRITAQLIYAPKDTNLWAQTYDRDLQDTLVLQSGVANAIAGEIKVQMTPSEQQRLQSPRLVNYSAVIAYLEGRSHLDKVAQLQFQKNLQKPTQEEFAKAVASFERAVQEDPNYPKAYLGFFEAMDSEGENHLELLAKTRDGIHKALALDDTLADAHIYMGRFLGQYEWNWAGAEKEYQRALKLSPNLAKAHEAYSEYLATMGRAAEADKEEELARRLDPACADSVDGPLGCLDFEQQLKYLEETGTPGHRCFLYGGVGKDLFEAGKYPEAIATFEKMMRVCGYPELADALARDYSHGDYRSAIRAWLAGMEKEIANHQPFPSLWMAFMYSALNDRSNALRWLEKAYENHSWCMLYLKDDAIWDPIRSDPRFADFVNRVGLPQ
jgi:TolB-like protein/DNA-binding winged helix-turn-helix (wHTH) protein